MYNKKRKIHSGVFLGTLDSLWFSFHPSIQRESREVCRQGAKDVYWAEIELLFDASYLLSLAIAHIIHSVFYEKI